MKEKGLETVLFLICIIVSPHIIFDTDFIKAHLLFIMNRRYWKTHWQKKRLNKHEVELLIRKKKNIEYLQYSMIRRLSMIKQTTFFEKNVDNATDTETASKSVILTPKINYMPISSTTWYQDTYNKKMAV